MIIHNEVEHAEKMLDNGFQFKKYIFLELLILSKYLIFRRSMDRDQVGQQLHDFCSHRLDGYHRDTTSKLINKVVKVASKSTLKEVKEVPITQLELNAIRELNDLAEEKIAFVMLVAYKVNNYYPFKIAMDELFELGNLRLNSTNRLKIIHSLTLKKKINSDQKLRRWVIFADKDGESILIVNKFKQIVMHYLQWRGEPIINCENCGMLTKQTSNRKKYCNDCWKLKDAELNKERCKRYYKNKNY